VQAESGVAAGGAPARPARRTVLGGILAAGAGFAAGGCSSKPPPGPDGSSPTPTPDPDVALVATVVEDKRALLARYAATGARFPGLAGRLAPLRADHLGHLEALHAEPEPTPSPGATATPGAPPPRPVPFVPADRKAATRALARAEQAAAGRRVPQCVAAVGRDLALLLASIGGCEAAHGLVLDQMADALPAAAAEKPKATPAARP
jgi:hypothetical protein